MLIFIQNIRTALFLSGCASVVMSCTSSKNATSAAKQPMTNKAWKVPLPGNAYINMQWVPPGTFVMGSPDSEAGRKSDEGPQTEVTLSRGYWLGKTELTAGQWKAVMGETLREHVLNMLKDETVYDFGNNQKKKIREFMNFRPDDPDRVLANEHDSVAMYFVSWEDAMKFCQKLTEQEKAAGRLPEGYKYTLPTEAQWEYACRAGTTSATFAGPLTTDGRNAPVLNDIAWYGGNNTVNYHGKKLGNAAAGPRNAGETRPNAWGLQDMPGNIWEWCRDVYAPYPGGKVIDYISSSTGTGRVNRGGSWGSGAATERSAARASNPQPEKSAYRGFRIALSSI